MKILSNNTYLLLIDEEAEIKEGWAINPDGNLNYFGFDWRATWTREQILDCKNVIAYYPLTKEAKELDLPLLPPIEEIIPNSGYEEGMFGYTDTEVRIAQNAFQEGYKAAQSKQFSLEDIKKAIDLTQQICDRNAHYVQRDRNVHVPMITIDEEEEIIQSLSTQQLPKEFIPRTYPKYTQYNGFEEDDEVPTISLMTTTNSQGQKVVQGTYKY